MVRLLNDHVGLSRLEVDSDRVDTANTLSIDNFQRAKGAAFLCLEIFNFHVAAACGRLYERFLLRGAARRRSL